MTRTKTLAGLALAALFSRAHAFEPFVVKDIRVEGIQRTEAGTVFSYLPVKVGETLDNEKAAQAIKALYATGFFKDVRLEVAADVLIVSLDERPAIAQIDLEGIKEFPKDDLKGALKQTGLAEGRIFDRALLDKAEQELKRQYYSRGKYAAEVTTTVTPLERNRVGIVFSVSEGEVAKIRGINIVGAQAFKEADLLGLFTLTTPGWLTWYTKNDQYSKQKLSADLETLRSHYLNQGYLEFNIDSTQVSITPDKKDIYITVGLIEGAKYTISDIRFGGDSPVPEAELRGLVDIKPGDVFNREKITELTKRIGDRLGNDGHAFANVNAVPEIDKEKNTAAFTFFVDSGRRVYINRVNVAGNARTRDEVIRREVRQMEGAWYNQEQINRSKERIDKLGFFQEVNVETPAVSGTTDQVDVNYTVVEKPTGNVLLGAGFSSTDGLVLSGSISQNNIFGTGNRLSAQISSGGVNKLYSLSYTNPYFTVDGISLGYDVFKRKVNSSGLSSVGFYTTDSLGFGARLGIPLNERDTVNLGLAYENTEITTGTNSPTQYINFVNTFGSSNDTVRAEIGWARDSRDSLLYPTKGTLHRVFSEAGTPIGDLKYYKLSYQAQWFRPLTKTLVLMLNGEIGFGGGYGGKPLPFFRNFYAGGQTSVRGYDSATLGPKTLNANTGAIEAVGGDKRIVSNVELLFPMPGMGNDKSVRMSVFADAGATFGPNDYLGRYRNFQFDDLRYSVGAAVNWFSPFGPLKFSYAVALNPKSDDKKQGFQFTLGTIF